MNTSRTREPSARFPGRTATHLLLLAGLVLLLRFPLRPSAHAQYVHPRGTLRAAVVFVRFADDTLALGGASPRSLEWADPDALPAVAANLLAPSPSPPFPEQSLTDYFYRQSRGALTLYGDVYPSVLVTARPEAAYARRGEVNLSVLTREILAVLNDDPAFDLGAYDANGDGYIDQLFFILRNLDGLVLPNGAAGISTLGYRTTKPEYGNDPGALKEITISLTGSYLVYGSRGVIFPEVNLVRLMAHEFGHDLFAPLNYVHLSPLQLPEGTPLTDGRRIGYALMVGAPLAYDVRGDEILSAYERWLLGDDWISCRTLRRDTAVTVTDLYTGEDRNCYILRIPNSTYEPRRLFLSNRQRVGFFDRLRTSTCTSPPNQHGLRTTGLLAMLTHPQQPRNIAVIPADNTLQISNEARVYEGDLFGPETKTQLTPWTVPNINGFSTYPSFFEPQEGHFQAIDRIRYTGGPDGEMAFDYVADFRLRPVIREDSHIGPETDGYTFTTPFVVTHGSSLRISSSVTFADTLRVDPASTLIIEAGGRIEIADSGLLVLRGGARLINRGEARHDGRLHADPDAEIYPDPGPGEPSRTSAEPNRTDAPSGIELSAFPNPFREELTLAYALPTAAPVRMQVYDTAGRLVTTVVDEVLRAGTHRALWGVPPDLAAGLYMIRLEAGRTVTTRTAVRVR